MLYGRTVHVNLSTTNAEYEKCGILGDNASSDTH